MRLLPPALAIAGLLLAATAWSAPRIPAVSPPSVARAGERYETVLPELPAGIEECELLLLPEDGSGRAIRLTAEHEVGDGPLRWRMPRIAATRARLVLRAGGRFGETESAPSAPFAVESQGERDRAEVLRGEEELDWHFGDDDAPAPSAWLPPGAACLAEAVQTAVAIPPTRDSFVRAPGPTAFETAVSAPQRLETPEPPARTRRPAFVPLRN